MSKSLNKYDITLLKWLSKLSKPVYQNDIPKLTGLDLKIVTKSLYKLEKMNLVERKPAVHNKRRTYIVSVDVDKVSKMLEEYGESLLTLSELFKQIKEIPCISCQFIHKCYEGGFYDPIYCSLLSGYLSRYSLSRKTPQQVSKH
jgi:predicted transcriptional regulator